MQREEFVARRFRRRTSVPRLRKSDVLFERYADLLNPLMEFFTERGRLPRDGELFEAIQIGESALCSVRQAWRVVLTVTGEDEWSNITESKKEDLIIYLALARFGGRPKFSALERGLQGDVMAFFSSFRRACECADHLLFSAGNMEVIDRAMTTSPVGKLTGNALYIHQSALPLLPAVLRVYEGCARSYLGAVDGANIIKFGRWKPKISYLSYPQFETKGHPCLAEALILRLADQHVYYINYRNSDNPPILHRKELLVSSEHNLHSIFSRLTQREESLGLYSSHGSIGSSVEWSELLETLNIEIKGHQVHRVSKRRKPDSADPPDKSSSV